jgi:hypothetical protein
MSDLPKAVWSGEIMGVVVHVLDNGQRIVDGKSFASFLEKFLDPDPAFDLEGFADVFGHWMKYGTLPTGNGE